MVRQAVERGTAAGRAAAQPLPSGTRRGTPFSSSPFFSLSSTHSPHGLASFSSQYLESGKSVSAGVDPERKFTRPSGRVSFFNLPLEAATPTIATDGSSSPSEYLQAVIKERREARHKKPVIKDSARAKGVVVKLYNMLENLKERAMQSSYGRLHEAADSLQRVRGYVVRRAPTLTLTHPHIPSNPRR